MSMALLTSRLRVAGPPAEDPEDFFADSLGVVFEDDIMNRGVEDERSKLTTTDGDANHSLVYTSPHLPKPLTITLADPTGEDDRKLFSHYLWNASLLLAEFVEAGTLRSRTATATATNSPPSLTSPFGPSPTDFDVTDLATLELGAGTALPSLLAALVGARRVVATDYPAPVVISNLRSNAKRNAAASPSGAAIEVHGHAWGELDTAFAIANRRAFDRVLVCDCLWMPWCHGDLARSIEWFLAEGPRARCWLVAGFHGQGRAAMSDFFREENLGVLGLEVERLWERDCDGVEREWSWDRGWEDPGARKRWLAFAILRRRH